MKEVPALLSEREFQAELEDIRETMEKAGKKGIYSRTSFLIGCVVAETSPIFTPDQLSRLFELAKE